MQALKLLKERSDDKIFKDANILKNELPANYHEWGNETVLTEEEQKIYNNILTATSMSFLEKEFNNAEKNKDIKTMSQTFRILFELGFGGTNWKNEFEFL